MTGTKTDPLLVHEALDRCSLMASMVSDHLLEHQFVQETTEVHDKVSRAVGLLAEAYQEIGQYVALDKG